MFKRLIIMIVAALCAGQLYGQVMECKTVEGGGSGPYKAIIAAETNFDDYTVYRPADLQEAVRVEGKLPLIVFGNGGCANTSDAFEKFLTEIASHGYVVVAIGPYPPMQGRQGMTDASMLNKAIDLMQQEVDRPQSSFQGMVDMKKVAPMGQSCGGLQALAASLDERIMTTVVLNSGMFSGPGGGMGGAEITKNDLPRLHAPIIYMLGGKTDIAYENGMDDFNKIENVPAVCASLPVGHMATYREPLGGQFAKVALKWLDWQMKGKEGEAAFFMGDADGRQDMSEWTVLKKNF